MWVRALVSTAILLAWAHLAVAQHDPDRCNSDQPAFHGWVCEEWPSHPTEALRECLENRVVEALRLQHGSEVRSVNLDPSEHSLSRENYELSRGLVPDQLLATRLSITLTISQIEMDIETFHMSEPDEVVFREDWGGNREMFQSGFICNLR
jgi:trehalose utilization protein